MYLRIHSSLRLAVSVVLFGSSATISLAQSAAAPPEAGKSAAEVYKNIQVLQDVPAARLHDAMVFMSASLGVNCLSCHVRDERGEFAFEKDDREQKLTARKMIQMVRGINTQYFNSQERMTCASCHQSRREPSPLPPLSQALTAEQLAAMPPGGRGSASAPAPGQAAPAGQRGQMAGGPQGRGAGAARPTETVDQVLDKYADSSGGRAALESLKTRIRRGKLTDRRGQAENVTLEDTAAGLYRITIDTTPPATRAFDGKDGWVQAGPRSRELEGIESWYVGLMAELALPLRLKAGYQKLAVRSYGRVNGHQAIVIRGQRSADVLETLSFDRSSGLLLRRAIDLRTPLGSLPVQIDYDDYRLVSGVQVAYSVRVTDWESVSDMKFSDIQVNRPIDAARFSKPVQAER